MFITQQAPANTFATKKRWVNYKRPISKVTADLRTPEHCFKSKECFQGLTSNKPKEMMNRIEPTVLKREVTDLLNSAPLDLDKENALILMDLSNSSEINEASLKSQISTQDSGLSTIVDSKPLQVDSKKREDLRLQFIGYMAQQELVSHATQVTKLQTLITRWEQTNGGMDMMARTASLLTIIGETCAHLQSCLDFLIDIHTELKSKVDPDSLSPEISTLPHLSPQKKRGKVGQKKTSRNLKEELIQSDILDKTHTIL